jgi:NAD(P)-dependent dehydrogenase (short-subunit alcohol dehydrogenase family)
MNFEGKNALVLGASAAGGTGFAIARALAQGGANVTIAARSEDRLAVLAEKIGARHLRCDAGNPEDIRQLAQFATMDGNLDIAVNAAALPVIGSIATISTADVDAALQVNYLGMLHFLRETTERMNDEGSVVLISSYSAVQPIQPHFAYACARAATDCLVRYAALEFGPRGIRVNSVQPGPIKSDLAKDLFAIPGVDAIYAREIPLGRVGTPEDYADVALWLSGPAFVTGLNIPVNGGNQLTRMPRIDELPYGERSYEGDYA